MGEGGWVGGQVHAPPEGSLRELRHPRYPDGPGEEEAGDEQSADGVAWPRTGRIDRCIYVRDRYMSGG